MRSNSCSGAFSLLDATVNTQSEAAETSRMGVYLRFSDLKAVGTADQHIVYFRGAADVARKEQVQMHNRWDLEFDTEMIPGYNTLMDFSGKRLAEGCQWSERMLQEFSARVQTLTPTERVILQLFIEDCDIHEAAARAFISVGTARKHNTNINKKLCVSTREELMLYIDLFRRCDRLEELIYQN